MEPRQTAPAVVTACRIEAQTVRSFELTPVPQAGEPHPVITAGAHIDVVLPNGLVRQYSLLNPGERGRYVIAVNRDAASRGGSACLHEVVRVGDTLQVSAPRNHFPLHPDPAPSVLVAGGIGITPLFAMATSLSAQGRAWTLYYCARSRDRAAYAEALLQLAARYPQGNVVLHFDDACGGTLLDLAGIVGLHGNAAHYYCCGPAPLMQAFATATAGVPAPQVHTEFFGAPAAAGEHADAADFAVTLARSGRTLQVPAGRSLLDVLLDNGLRVLNSCREGVCGSCETRVLSGEPEHRDHVLSADERAANRSMMVCVSRCRGTGLTLDL